MAGGAAVLQVHETEREGWGPGHLDPADGGLWPERGVGLEAGSRLAQQMGPSGPRAEVACEQGASWVATSPLCYPAAPPTVDVSSPEVSFGLCVLATGFLSLLWNFLRVDVLS